MGEPETTDPEIKVQPDGPYVVRGGVALNRRRAVRSEHGEPMTWQTTEWFDAGPVFALCRCGGSADKPFCDGTHASNGFAGTETAPTDTYEERATVLEGIGVVVRDDRGICEHAGFCGNRMTNVWDMVGGSGTEDSVVRAQMMAMIQNCPSGALTFRLTDDDLDIEPELPLAVSVIDDGPLWVTGGVRVARADGQPVEARNRVTLCRCGGSSSKPLCDGTHKNIGFSD